jgi:E3 ubiquitin-protein ligase DMA1/2
MDPKNYPQFLCPNCRAVADLEADIDEVSANWGDDGNSSDSEVAKITGNRTRGGTRVGAGANNSEQEQLDRAIAASLRESLQIGEAEGAAATTDSSAEERELPEDSTQAVHTPPTPTSPQIARVDVGPSLSDLTSPTTPANTVTIALADPPPGRHSANARASIGRASSSSGDAAEPEQSEGPLTPRNEAGPFIFDGGGEDMCGSRVRQASS